MGGPRRRRGRNRCFWLSKRVLGGGWKGKSLVFVVEICEDMGLWHGWDVEVLGRRPQVLCSGNYYRLGVYICCWTQPYQPYEAEVTNSPISNICSISSNTAGGMGVFLQKEFRDG